ncbi:MAG: hypothetical protein ACYDG4_15385 [Desulfuromonadaceae bacterium]
MKMYVMGNSGWNLRGDKYGKIYFWQVLEFVMDAEFFNDGGISKLKRLNGLRYLRIAADTGIATIMIFVLFIGGTRALMRWGTIRRRCLITCCNFTLHGMSTFMHAIDRNSQNYHEEKQGKEFWKHYISHS